MTTTTTTDLQATRRANLIALMDQHHCWPSCSDRPSAYNNDYDDTYAELAGVYLGIEFSDDLFHATETVSDPDELTPRYASTRHDENYSMISVFESLSAALEDSNGGDGEYLNVGGQVTDLDTGEIVQARPVMLTVDALAEVRALLADADLSAQNGDLIRTALEL